MKTREILKNVRTTPKIEKKNVRKLIHIYLENAFKKKFLSAIFMFSGPTYMEKSYGGQKKCILLTTQKRQNNSENRKKCSKINTYLYLSQKRFKKKCISAIFMFSGPNILRYGGQKKFSNL